MFSFTKRQFKHIFLLVDALLCRGLFAYRWPQSSNIILSFVTLFLMVWTWIRLGCHASGADRDPVGIVSLMMQVQKMAQRVCHELWKSIFFNVQTSCHWLLFYISFFQKTNLCWVFVAVTFLMTRSVCHILSQTQFHHHSAVLCLNQYLMIIDCNFGQQPLSLSESVTHTNLNHFYLIYDYIEYSIGLYTKFNEVCALSRKIY